MLALVAVAGAASSSAAPRAGQQADDAQASATLTVRSSRFGRILFDGRGRALLCLHPRPAGRAQPVLRRLRESVAGLLREGTSARRQGRAAVADRCDPAPRRSAPGHVQRAAALLLRRRQEPRPDPVPERRRVRRHLAGRTAEWAARSIADPFASRAEAVGHGEGPATQAPALLRTERPSPG